MALSALKTQSLTERATRAVAESTTVDKAIAHLAGVIYPTFSLERISLCMQLRSEHLVVAAAWMRRLSRVGKGTVLRSSATSYPEVLLSRRVVVSAETGRVPLADALRDEGIEAWASIPMPSPQRIEGMLNLEATVDIFSKQRAFLTQLGFAVGEQLVELAHQSLVFQGAQVRL